MHMHTRATDTTKLIAIGTGAAVLVWGASRRGRSGRWLAAASLPFFYHAFVGRWPQRAFARDANEETRRELGGSGGVRVHEAIRLERPVSEVYAFWRRLENLPRFMDHLSSVEETGPRLSHWVAKGPAGIRVEWDAELFNEEENKLLAWRSLPGSDVVTAGSVNFASVRNGQETQVSVTLQYSPPAGKAGAAFAALFGAEPSQTIREDLRKFKQVLEAGEIPQATPTASRM
jgi:uncharacterized membrane protein